MDGLSENILPPASADSSVKTSFCGWMKLRKVLFLALLSFLWNMLLFLLIYSGYWWWKAWVVLQNPEHNLYFCNEIKGLTAATALLVSCKLNSNPHRQIRHHWVLPVCLQCVSEFCICSEAITDVKWELLLIPCWFLFHLKVNINPVEWNRKSFSAPGLRNKIR